MGGSTGSGWDAQVEFFTSRIIWQIVLQLPRREPFDNLTLAHYVGDRVK